MEGWVGPTQPMNWDKVGEKSEAVVTRKWESWDLIVRNLHRECIKLVRGGGWVNNHESGFSWWRILKNFLFGRRLLYNIVLISAVQQHESAIRACILSHFSRVQLLAALWTGAHQVPLSLGFPRQEHWSGLPFPPPGDLPNPGIEPLVSYVSCIGRRVLYH